MHDVSCEKGMKETAWGRTSSCVFSSKFCIMYARALSRLSWCGWLKLNQSSVRPITRWAALVRLNGIFALLQGETGSSFQLGSEPSPHPKCKCPRARFGIQPFAAPGCSCCSSGLFHFLIGMICGLKVHEGPPPDFFLLVVEHVAASGSAQAPSSPLSL